MRFINLAPLRLLFAKIEREVNWGNKFESQMWLFSANLNSMSKICNKEQKKKKIFHERNFFASFAFMRRKLFASVESKIKFLDFHFNMKMGMPEMTTFDTCKHVHSQMLIMNSSFIQTREGIFDASSFSFKINPRKQEKKFQPFQRIWRCKLNILCLHLHNIYSSKFSFCVRCVIFTLFRRYKPF